jgi:hypothetical protein
VQPDEKNDEFETALAAAIQQDQAVLENIKKDWTEVNMRMQKRANLLQTLQNGHHVDYTSGEGILDAQDLIMSQNPSKKHLLTINDERRTSSINPQQIRRARKTVVPFAKQESPDQK